jgi:hypothetical protein
MLKGLWDFVFGHLKQLFGQLKRKRPVELRPNALTDFDEILHITNPHKGLLEAFISSKKELTVSRFSPKTAKTPLAWRPNAPLDFDEIWPLASPLGELLGALISSKKIFTVSRISAAKFFFRIYYRSLRPNGGT